MDMFDGSNKNDIKYEYDFPFIMYNFSQIGILTNTLFKFKVFHYLKHTYKSTKIT